MPVMSPSVGLSAGVPFSSENKQAAWRRPSIAAACSGCFPLTLAWLLLIGEPSPNVLNYWLGSPLVVAVVCVWCVVVCEGEGGGGLLVDVQNAGEGKHKPALGCPLTPGVRVLLRSSKRYELSVLLAYSGGGGDMKGWPCGV